MEHQGFIDKFPDFLSKACLTGRNKSSRVVQKGFQFIFSLLAGLPGIAYLKLSERFIVLKFLKD